MSRAAAAQSGSTITKPLHLIVQHSNNDTVKLMVSSDEYPVNQSIAMTSKELQFFRQNIWYLLQAANRPVRGQGNDRRLSLRNTSDNSSTKLPDTTLTHILGFIIRPNVMTFLMDRLVAGISISQDETITRYDSALSVELTKSNDSGLSIHVSSFFDYTPQDLPSLLNASLNANLDDVKRIISKASPDRLRWLLQTPNTAMTTLGRITVERTGTALQMAIYDHDEEMVAYFKEKMDPTEFERQSKEAFATALSPEKRAELEQKNVTALDYHQAMLKAQQEDAEALCAELEDVFKNTSAAQFSRDAKYVASTSSAQLQNAVDAFINRLTDYVKRNPVHNPYILQLVYKIYNRLPSDFNRDCFFSQKMIGGAQSFLSMRWLQHYAQGVDDLSDDTNLVARRDFASFDVDGNRADIRHLVTSSIGRDSFLSTSPSNEVGPGPAGGERVGFYKTYVEQKQQAFRTYYAASATVSLHNCVK